MPYAAFIRDPSAHRLNTPTGRIELYSATIDGFGYDDCPGHPVWIPPREYLGSPRAQVYPLHLLTTQPATRLHSQWDHVGVSKDSKIAGREPLTLHADDAAERGIAEGDVVRVFNDRGACLAGVRLTRDMVRGVAVLATGAWLDSRDGTVRARQPQCADPGCRHVTSGAGAGGAKLPGANGTLRGRTSRRYVRTTCRRLKQRRSLASRDSAGSGRHAGRLAARHRGELRGGVARVGPHARSVV